MQQGGGCLPSNGWNNITTLEEGSNFDEGKTCKNRHLSDESLIESDRDTAAGNAIIG